LKTAELLKVKFGSASWQEKNRDNEIVSIPGLRGRESQKKFH
jgi:cell division protein FtsA